MLHTLHRAQLYLTKKKVHFFANELRILGRIIDGDGIHMDPAKVDKVINWKVPTNRDLLRGFLGSVGYLADDIASVRIPMGLLHSLTSADKPFIWTNTHQRAFEQIKTEVEKFCNHHRVPL